MILGLLALLISSVLICSISFTVIFFYFISFSNLVNLEVKGIVISEYTASEVI